MNISIYRISRCAVESLDCNAFITAHGTWPMLKGKALRQLKNSLIIEVDGYNDDPREIYSIPEVRAYFQKLHELWPWWSFFCYTGGNYLAVLYMCLLEKVVDPVPATQQHLSAVRFDPHELQNLILNEFQFLNFLCDRAGMTEEEGDTHSQSICDMFLSFSKEEAQ